MPRKIKISWEQFETDIEFLANQLRDKGFTMILAITKGGLIPAYYLAKHLDIKFIETEGVGSYEGREQKKTKVYKMAHLSDSKEVLIVDDLIDTGETIRFLKGAEYEKASVAVLYEKESSPKGLSDYYVRRYISDPWIEFPWE